MMAEDKFGESRLPILEAEKEVSEHDMQQENKHLKSLTAHAVKRFDMARRASVRYQQQAQKRGALLQRLVNFFKDKESTEECPICHGSFETHNKWCVYKDIEEHLDVSRKVSLQPSPH